jgi:hypothetical protein
MLANIIANALFWGGIICAAVGVAWGLWVSLSKPPMAEYISEKPVHDERSSISRSNDIMGKKV